MSEPDIIVNGERWIDCTDWTDEQLDRFVAERQPEKRRITVRASQLVAEPEPA